MKRFFVCCFFMVAFVGLTCLSACHDSNNNQDKSSISLISAAQEEIAKTQPNAFIVWAGGRRADGTAMTRPEKADTWDFTAVDTSVPQTLSWDLALSHGDWSVTPRQFPPMEITYMDLTDVWMDVSAAWSLAQLAGVHENLRTWELYEELNPDFPNPLFLIVLESGKKLYVDAVTGDEWFDALSGEPVNAGEDAVLKTIIVADQKIKSVNADAVVIKASGMHSSGNNMSATTETDMYDFICCAKVGDGQTRYWQVYYSKNQNWSVWDMPTDYTPDGFTRTDLTKVIMAGETAWETVKANSSAEEIMTWELFLPDDATISKSPIYLFLDQVTDWIAIKTDTGEVFIYY